MKAPLRTLDVAACGMPSCVSRTWLACSKVRGETSWKSFGSGRTRRCCSGAANSMLRVTGQRASGGGQRAVEGDSPAVAENVVRRVVVGKQAVFLAAHAANVDRFCAVAVGGENLVVDAPR